MQSNQIAFENAKQEDDVTEPKKGIDRNEVPFEPSSGLVNQAKTVASKAGSDAKDVVEDVKSRTTSLSGEAGDKISAIATHRKNNAADQLDALAKSVHRAGEQFEGQQDMVAKLIERGADELGSFASTLRSNDLKGLATQLQSLAKRQPALFVGAAFIAGFAVLRFGKVAAAGATASDLPHLPEKPHVG